MANALPDPTDVTRDVERVLVVSASLASAWAAPWVLACVYAVFGHNAAPLQVGGLLVLAVWAVWAALLGGLAMRWGVRSRSPARAVLGGIAGGVAFLIGAAALSSARLTEVPAMVLGAATLGLVFSVPTGLLFGIGFATPLRSMAASLHRPSAESAGWAWLWGAALLAAAAFVVALLATPAEGPYCLSYASLVHGVQPSDLESLPPGLDIAWTRFALALIPPLALGALMAVKGWLVLRDVRRFRREVVSGASAEWTLVSGPEGYPLTEADRFGADHRLMSRADIYRATLSDWAVHVALATPLREGSAQERSVRQPAA